MTVANPITMRNKAPITIAVRIVDITTLNRHLHKYYL
ncbi:hypothetical protein ABH901_002560 [Mammaliicoccus lentus]